MNSKQYFRKTINAIFICSVLAIVQFINQFESLELWPNESLLWVGVRLLVLAVALYGLFCLFRGAYHFLKEMTTWVIRKKDK